MRLESLFKNFFYISEVVLHELWKNIVVLYCEIYSLIFSSISLSFIFLTPNNYQVWHYFNQKAKLHFWFNSMKGFAKIILFELVNCIPSKSCYLRSKLGFHWSRQWRGESSTASTTRFGAGMATWRQWREQVGSLWQASCHFVLLFPLAQNNIRVRTLDASEVISSRARRIIHERSRPWNSVTLPGYWW